ncbi:MAG TPA: adenylyltransferase/cytidyltransferase family protein [Candidatus Nanoarchaeia archaeon]|nr:adenylyltransferase/cytidyltransferase family protein [Candidatus Nanoarchaeia archaeon]
MTTVLCTGTFDMLHAGHLNYFEQAKKLADTLVVIVARDTTVEKERKKKPVMNEQDRLKIIQSLKIVDKAVLGNEHDKLKTVEKLKPGIICLGYDQRVDESELAQQLKTRGINAKIIRAKPYKETIYKSSILKSHQCLSNNP